MNENNIRVRMIFELAVGQNIVLNGQNAARIESLERDIRTNNYTITGKVYTTGETVKQVFTPADFNRVYEPVNITSKILFLNDGVLSDIKSQPICRLSEAKPQSIFVEKILELVESV